MRFLAIKRRGVAKERSQRCKVELRVFMKSDEVIGSDSRGNKLLSAGPSNPISSSSRFWLGIHLYVWFFVFFFSSAFADDVPVERC